METNTTKPMETIKNWQEWYNKHRVDVINEPGETKKSRESLHDTSNAVDTMPDWRGYYKELIKNPTETSVFKEKATAYFSDTLAEFANELTAAEIFDCFLAAAREQLNHIEKERMRALELFKLIEGKNNEN
jgi:hypothetical protein